MPLQSLYINEENLIELKKEINMSQLINKLLETHYQSLISPKDKFEEVKKDIELKVNKLNELAEDVEKMEKLREEMRNKKLEEIEEREYSEERNLKKIDLLKECFENYEIEKEKLDELFNEFMELYISKDMSIMEFMELKGIGRKVKRWR